ncbi:hypothetical protein [Massilia glaciei]|uniref:hypothetical protein n=1 Tax=Massilia glaciei TaxID=1524097 RepID=UPI0011B25C8B|nr:hypothetical protein [Massilia glaciei]
MVIREGEGFKDRITMRPLALRSPSCRHCSSILRVEALHQGIKQIRRQAMASQIPTMENAVAANGRNDFAQAA